MIPGYMKHNKFLVNKRAYFFRKRELRYITLERPVGGSDIFNQSPSTQKYVYEKRRNIVKGPFGERFHIKSEVADFLRLFRPIGKVA